MFNSKFDIFSSEWIERVFENRNKNYGAYELRKNYASTVVRALLITVMVLAAFFTGLALLFNHQATAVTVNKNSLDVNNRPLVVIPEKNKSSSQSPSGNHQNTAANNPAKGRATPKAWHQPTERVQATSAGIENNRPAGQPSAADPDSHSGHASAGVIDREDADVKPALPGGAEAWSKFLEANLHYPPLAKQLRLSGKVWVSFIVERDGHVSNIAVEHSAGNDFDEEAVRVLKLSPVWIPGMQNGQPVRVKYTLPINFHIEQR